MGSIPGYYLGMDCDSLILVQLTECAYSGFTISSHNNHSLRNRPRKVRIARKGGLNTYFLGGAL